MLQNKFVADKKTPLVHKDLNHW